MSAKGKQKATGKKKEKPVKAKGPTRAELLQKGRSKKIPNVGVMTKQELTTILAPDASEETIRRISKQAVQRWHTCPFFHRPKEKKGKGTPKKPSAKKPKAAKKAKAQKPESKVKPPEPKSEIKPEAAKETGGGSA